MGSNRLNLFTDTFTMSLMRSTSALLESVHFSQKCFPGCLYHSEMLVEGTGFKMGFFFFFNLSGMEGATEAIVTKAQTFLVLDNHCEAPNKGNERQPAQVS